MRRNEYRWIAINAGLTRAQRRLLLLVHRQHLDVSVASATAGIRAQDMKESLRLAEDRVWESIIRARPYMSKSLREANAILQMFRNKISKGQPQGDSDGVVVPGGVSVDDLVFAHVLDELDELEELEQRAQEDQARRGLAGDLANV